MARNEEKAQSMLYRFREAQAAELGLGVRGDKRPRMASSCQSLRECERWRGEILREISRKVSKIQDAGLTDYEIRDVNDEINRLLREKRHWENQIVALGGANYRRNVAMLDDDGREVPGTKGYKYFGRAKELPGVKELFESKKKEEDEENAVTAHYKKFLGQGPEYFGDLAEEDEELVKWEKEQEVDDWDEACNNVNGALGLPEDAPKIPYPIPQGAATTLKAVGEELANVAAMATTKRKDPPSPQSNDVPPATKTKTETSTSATTTPAVPPPPPTPGQLAHNAASMAAAYIPFLSTEDLMPPKLPTREEMEGVILGLKKKALMEQYFGPGGGEVGVGA